MKGGGKENIAITKRANGFHTSQPRFPKRAPARIDADEVLRSSDKILSVGFNLDLNAILQSTVQYEQIGKLLFLRMVNCNDWILIMASSHRAYLKCSATSTPSLGDHDE